MRLVFIGSGEFGLECLKWLGQSDHEMLEVITQPARPFGRGRKVKATAICRQAKELGLAVQETDNINESSFVDHIRSLHPDILLVIAFGQKIGPSFLNQSEFRTINLHGSLLPKYRGAAPINRVIINGEKETGITIIEMDQNWDTGDILGGKSTPIKTSETAGELHDRLAQLGPDLLEDVLAQIDRGENRPQKQDDSQATTAPKLYKADGAICWTESAEHIRNQVHGMWPWPGASCYLQQAHDKPKERLNVVRAEVVGTTGSTDLSSACQTPGTITVDFTIICGTGQLRLLEVKPQNSVLMSFNDFANGRHIQSGDRFLDG
ncbi:MAG: methionyl-tRNA formyltransferase [Planctomycetes bacterium]|nr:methionyl-tRNA formyltransferase [Planctomycetota bacterium]